MTRQDRPDGFVDALARGLAVLSAFDGALPGMTLSEIARRADLSPATARRSLITLVSLGYVGRSGRRFHLRPRVLSLGSTFAISSQLGAILRPELSALVARFGGGAAAGTLDGNAVICLEHQATPVSARVIGANGAYHPAIHTAIGRTLLSGFNGEQLETWFDRLSDSDPRPLAYAPPLDRRAMRARIRPIRQRGYEVNAGRGPGTLCGIAVPILDLDRQVIAAINSIDETCATSEQLVDERLAELTAAAARISRQLVRVPMLTELLRPVPASILPG